ncbi:MAG: hypothetical protein CMQ67_00265 [Gammaproteobacteria bacterium]|nr:hypothetical protein [Gammaproteobacteria bacterium]|tara:strand:+ start:839 stop:1138 length:300 start_codon:yes stop_codon:yes gene_type:complete
MEKKSNGLAIASMVLGICSLVFYIFFGFVLGIVAVILGHIQLSNISKNPKLFDGRGMAIAGLVCGYISVAFALISLVFLSAALSALPALDELLFLLEDF